MSKEISLMANIFILPLNSGEIPDGYEEGDRGTSHEHKRFDPNAKEIVLVDPHSGEVFHYRMPGKMVRMITGKLKQSNKSLTAQLKKEQEDERAREILAGGNGIGGPQLTPEQMEELRRASGG